MKAEVSIDDLLKFRRKYQENSANSIIEGKIKQLGLRSACGSGAKYKFRFNVEVPKVKIYHQHDSHQCNIYAFLRVVKDILRQRGRVEIANLDFSANFIGFYDKLEKINAFYNDLINTDELTTKLIAERADWLVGSYGTFHLCREIVNKYGLVLAKDMPEVNKSYDDALTVELLRDKVKTDATVLLKMSSKVEKLSKKSSLMYEAYQFLAKVYGVPPASFEFQDKTFTPASFKKCLLGEELEDYATVTPFDKDALIESYAFIPNLYLRDSETILHATPAKIKEAIIKQLISGVSVWFSAEESTAASYSNWVLDDKLYNFDKLLNIKNLPTAQKLALGIINYDHAMCITGALTKNNAVEQFRVDNSFGRRGKYGGRMLMTTSFLENYVLTLILNKKFLV